MAKRSNDIQIVKHVVLNSVVLIYSWSYFLGIMFWFPFPFLTGIIPSCWSYWRTLDCARVENSPCMIVSDSFSSFKLFFWRFLFCYGCSWYTGNSLICWILIPSVPFWYFKSDWHLITCFLKVLLLNTQKFVVYIFHFVSLCWNSSFLCPATGYSSISESQRMLVKLMLTYGINIVIVA